MSTTFLGFDHIDSRVKDLARVEPFYDRLMPWLGLTKKGYVVVRGDEWTPATRDDAYNTIEFFEESERAPRFFGVVEDPNWKPSLTRIAFRVAPGTDLAGAAAFLKTIGAQNVELAADLENYPAVFFEDPLGARSELLAERAPRGVYP